MSVLTESFLRTGVEMCEVFPGISVPEIFSHLAKEHRAVRQSVGLFDFSFMWAAELTGRDVLTLVAKLQPRRVDAMRPGQIIYTLLCRDDGTVLNDATLWCHSPDRFWLFTGRPSDRHHVREVASNLSVSIRELSGRLSVLAIQGPNSPRLLSRLCGDDLVSDLRFFRFQSADILGWSSTVGRLGYSGELGYEIIVDQEHGEYVWDHLLEFGLDSGLVECGFATADTLRIESGFILFANELRHPVTPYMLGMERFLQRGAGYVGAEALRGMARTPPPVKLVGLMLHDDQRSGSAGHRSVSDHDFDVLEPGTALVTSECWSPAFRSRLMLAFVKYGNHHPGSTVRLPHGGAATVTRLPFYDPSRRMPRRRLNA